MADQQIITRASAMKEGLRHYFTGKTCKHGHITLRLTGSGCCVECSRLKAKAFYHRDQKSEEKRAGRDAIRRKVIVTLSNLPRLNLAYCCKTA